MKTQLLFTLMLLSFIVVNAQNNKHYYYVEAFKEQEVRLAFKKDYTFRLYDITGCNQFEYTGKYKSQDNFFIFHSVVYKNLLSQNTEPFPISDGDTAWEVNSERLYIHGKPFKITPTPDVNLQEIRYKKLKDYYIEMLGKDGFIQAFGRGKGFAEAKKRLIDCQLPDINLK